MTTSVEYAAIKGAIINLTKYLASYLGKYNIRVKIVSPQEVFTTTSLKPL
jgi:NAD(P)-dependent dehydrogenase (short-subunit alcohol dehydrogenase family)